MELGLKGKKVLVTGGSGGIGKACALGFAREGADVAIVDVKDAEGAETVRELRELGSDARYYSCDLGERANIEKTVAEIAGTYGRIDVAFNNAGIGGPGGIPTLDEQALEIWDRLMRINLTAVFHCCREEGKYMIPAGGGCIINTASMSATAVNHFPDSHFGASTIAYCASKAGVRPYTKALAMEWAKYNIRVNCISPGYVKTPFTAKLSEARFKHVLDMQHATVPMGRRAEAEEIVGGVLYLASDAASYVTGLDLLMDGGYSVW